MESNNPTTKYQPPKLSDYSSIAVRRDLSGFALLQFFKIMKRWKVSEEDVRLLLGGISDHRYQRLTGRPEGKILNQDQLLRVTTVIAIDQALIKLYPGPLAEQWVQTPRVELPWGTPMANFIRGGVNCLWIWRQMLESEAFDRQEQINKK